MNYRDLLKKYLAHLIDIEHSLMLAGARWYSNVKFNEEEFNEIQKIIKEINNDE